jgi:hypothetical protein
LAGGLLAAATVNITGGPSLTSELHAGAGEGVSEEEHAWDRAIDAPTQATNHARTMGHCRPRNARRSRTLGIFCMGGKRWQV